MEAKTADTRASNEAREKKESTTYSKPSIKTLDQKDVLTAVKKGSKFPARGFAG